MAKWEKSGKTETGSVKPGSGDAGAEATEKSHDVQFAKGGKTKMFSEQEAGEAQSGYTEKKDARGPGEKFAEGGKNKMFSFAGAQPAEAGKTSAR